MPKDATKNVDRYKIRGGQLNEFDFHQNQEEYAKEKENSLTGKQLIPSKAAKGTAKASKAAKTSKSTKNSKSTKASKAPTGASPKKLAARKSAKKK